MRRANMALMLPAALVAFGCGQPASDDETEVAAPVEHMATGTLNSIDRTAGTVNITHTAVPSAGWPEMTMNFKLGEPAAAADLKPGQRVDFHFKIDNGMDATVTFIAPLD